VSPRTVQNWEQKRREPEGAAKALLMVTARHPRIVLEALHAACLSAGSRPHRQRVAVHILGVGLQADPRIGVYQVDVRPTIYEVKVR
jgi:hypothetical protein